MDKGYIPVINVGGFERFARAVEKECKRYGVPVPDRDKVMEYAQTHLCKRAFEAWRKDELETMQQIEAENAAVVQADIRRMATDVLEHTFRKMFHLPHTWIQEDVFSWECIRDHLKEQAETTQPIEWDRLIEKQLQALKRLEDAIFERISSEVGDPDGQPCPEDP